MYVRGDSAGSDCCAHEIEGFRDRDRFTQTAMSARRLAHGLDGCRHAFGVKALNGVEG